MAGFGYGGERRIKVAKEQEAAVKKVNTQDKGSGSASKGKKASYQKGKKAASKK